MLQTKILLKTPCFHLASFHYKTIHTALLLIRGLLPHFLWQLECRRVITSFMLLQCPDFETHIRVNLTGIHMNSAGRKLLKISQHTSDQNVSNVKALQQVLLTNGD